MGDDAAVRNNAAMRQIISKPMTCHQIGAGVTYHYCGLYDLICFHRIQLHKGSSPFVFCMLLQLLLEHGIGPPCGMGLHNCDAQYHYCASASRHTVASG